MPAFKQRFYGLLAEWLGKGLQNLVRRFESARDLQKKSHSDLSGWLFSVISQQLSVIREQSTVISYQNNVGVILRPPGGLGHQSGNQP